MQSVTATFGARAGEPARRALVNRAAYGVSALAGFHPWRVAHRDEFHTPIRPMIVYVRIPLSGEIDAAWLGYCRLEKRRMRGRLH
jgi:hypothetical protein